MKNKRIVEVKEVNELLKRVRGLFGLSFLLTLVIILYISLWLLIPEIWGKINMWSIGFFAFASFLLTIAQLRTMRFLGLTSREEINRLAFLDELTGVYNYRYLEEFLRRELERVKMFSYPLSLIYIDIDHFKKVNDRFNHEAGNQVLRKFGQLLKSSVREIDVVGRIGGDEFLIVLPLTAVNEALPVAERIRTKFKETEFEVGDGEKVDFLTLSLGVVSTPPLPPERDVLIREADEAMYRAKREGGDKTSL